MVNSHRYNQNVTLWEYNNPFERNYIVPGQTDRKGTEFGSFHFKGIWISREGEGLAKDIVIGSSSQDQRGMNRDFELQTYVST
jgi:hypothetical protein